MPKHSRTSIDVFVGARVRALRTTHGLSQSEFGKILGVTFQQVQKYEKGDNRLSIAHMLILRDRYGVALDSFVPKIDDATKGASTTAKKAKRIATADDFQSAESVSLVRAFHTIKDKKLRTRLLSFIRALAREWKIED